MRFAITIAVFALCIVLAGCGGRGEPSTPTACLEGTEAYLAALQTAPGEVKLDDETKISDCLVENQSGGDLAAVGQAMVEAATKLNGDARAEPAGPGALRLGYLLGSVDAAAAKSGGIHAELLRRLTVAARYSPEGPLPDSFQRAYAEGFDAATRKQP